MKAIVRDRYGSADVLRLSDVEVPEVGDEQVLVRVRAAGLDRGAWHVMAGLPYLLRVAGYGLRRPKVAGLGSELAGVVEAVGAKVTGLEPGEAVFGTCSASFAEYASTEPDKLARMPANLSFEQAAAVPVSAVTALQALRDRGRVKAGQHVLVIGASGGVGTFAVQIAKALGANVTGVSSTQKLDLVRSLGADHVIDYTHADITDDGKRYDVVLDIGGNRPLSRLRRVLTSDGTLVIVGGEGGGRWTGGIHRQLGAMVLSLFVRQRLGTFIAKPNSTDLDALRALIEAGSVTPAVDRVIALDQVPDAIRDLTRRTRARQDHHRRRRASEPMNREATSPTWDCIIVGAGPAGLNAALVLGRARWRVLVLDNGAPRNYATHEMHGVLGHDGLDPAELRACGRAELARYGVEVVSLEMQDAEVLGGPFESRALVMPSSRGQFSWPQGWSTGSPTFRASPTSGDQRAHLSVLRRLRAPRRAPRRARRRRPRRAPRGAAAPVVRRRRLAQQWPAQPRCRPTRACAGGRRPRHRDARRWAGQPRRAPAPRPARRRSDARPRRAVLLHRADKYKSHPWASRSVFHAHQSLRPSRPDA